MIIVALQSLNLMANNMHRYSSIQRSIVLWVMAVAVIQPSMSYSANCTEASLAYTGAYDVQHTKKPTSHTQQLSYSVLAKYPAIGILSYYNNMLGSKGWEKYSKRHVNKYIYNDIREWQFFIDATKEVEIGVHQLIALWIDKEETRVCNLIMRYLHTVEPKNSAEYPSNNVLHVFIQEMPYYEQGKEPKFVQ